MITGINHLTFAVRDLGTSLAFYRDVLGLRLVARWPKGAYLLAGDLWIALIVDPATRPDALPDYTHAAFHVPKDAFEAAAARIRDSGATVWKDNRSEGASLYFLDPNGHKLEIHATDLAARLADGKAKPWDGLEIFD